MSYNTKIFALFFCILGGFGALTFQYNMVAGALGIASVVMLVITLLAQRKISNDNSASINAKYAEFTKALRDTHVLAIRKLARADHRADHRVIAAIVAKLIKAGSHVGSNPAWRSTQRITTASDIIARYDAGKALADEARSMIDSYVPPESDP